MIGIQPGHVIIIILVALLLFAPSRLPLLVRGVKKMISEVRDETSDKRKNPGDGSDAAKTPPSSRE